MGCGASKSAQHEEDEYYEEESRSVQTSARFNNRLPTPISTPEDGRVSKSDKSVIESDKWDTFEIASSDRGNTAKDSGYGRGRSVERILKAQNVNNDMDLPNRVNSAVQRPDRISPPPRRRRISENDRYDMPSPRRRYSPPPDYRGRPPPRRMPPRGYDSDPDEFRRRRRSFDDRRRGSIEPVRRPRRLEDDLDEGYRSDANSKQRPTPPGNGEKMPGREPQRRQMPPAPGQQVNGRNDVNRNPRRPHSAPGDDIKRRPEENSAQSKLYQRRPIRSTNEQNTRTKPMSKDSMRNQNNVKNQNDVNKKKPAFVSVASDPSIRVAANHKKGQAPPPWKFSYTQPKPLWSNEYYNTTD